MNHDEVGDRLFHRAMELFRIRCPAEYQRLGVLLLGAQEEGRYTPTITASSFIATLRFGQHEIRVTIRQHGLCLWAGRQDGISILLWWPEDENAQYFNVDLEPELTAALDQELVLDDMSSVR
ncbi:MAG: hypothetical protein AB7L09_02445 [Nitrospira sp.]